MERYTHNGTELTPQNGYIIHPETSIAYPLSWAEMGDIVIEDLPEPEPVPQEPQPRTWQPREFMDLFPIEKQLAIQSASRTNDYVGLWYSKFLGTNPIVEGSELLQEGLQFMVQAEILTQQDIDNALSLT